MRTTIIIICLLAAVVLFGFAFFAALRSKSGHPALIPGGLFAFALAFLIMEWT